MKNDRTGEDRDSYAKERDAGYSGRPDGSRASSFEVLLEAANERAGAALRREQAMRDSLSWRLTSPFRKVSAKVPTSLRAKLRKLAKASWWAVTPWRMPERLRAMRARTAAESTLRGSSDPNDLYGVWIDTIESRALAVAGDTARTLRVSLLIFAGDDVAGLQQTLASLRSQAFNGWQALVAVARAGSGAIAAALEDAARDTRIVRMPFDGESRAQGLAFAAAEARAEFIAVLDAGDVLAAGALVEFARALERAPQSDIFYGDEDELSVEGLRQKPYFKPSWSPDLLYTFNYFGRLTLLRRELVFAAGGIDSTMREGLEWDLNLRVSDRSGVVTRIPKVLCHRRVGPANERPTADSEAAANHRDALRNYWARSGIAARIETQSDGTQRATWGIEAPPLVSIVIPTRDKVDLLRVCIEGVLRDTAYDNKEIILVDTGSVEPQTWAYYDEMRGDARVSVVHFDKKFNYSAACNHGATSARGSLLLFLNNDIEVLTPDWLAELVRYALRPGVGVVGTKLIYPDGQLQHAGVGVGVNLCSLMYRTAPSKEWGVFGSPDHPRNWLAIMGACQMVRRNAFERVGGFDESYLVACSDVALCLNIWRAGFRIAYAPYALLRHHEGATRGNVNPAPDLQRLSDDIRLLGIDEDPFLHPELDARESIPSLRIGTAPSARQSLMHDTRALGSLMFPTSVLDLSNDRSFLEAAGLPREEVVWAPQSAESIADVWSAARWCLDLLRTRVDIARHFPKALSDGAQGDFGRWISGEGGELLGLTEAARALVVGSLSMNIGARARQAYLFHDNIKDTLPCGLLPIGQFELFRWFARRGRCLADLRLEEIWWLLREAAEEPVRELLLAYSFNPSWQALYPDGLTVFGKQAFAAWFASVYRVKESWIDSTQWPLEMEPAEQLRLAWLARKDWRLRHPEGLANAPSAAALVEWLATPEAAQPPNVVAWCAALDVPRLISHMLVSGVNVIGHFSYPSGLRVSVEALVNGLQGVGLQTSLRDVKTDRKDDPTHVNFRGFEQFETTLIHVQPEPLFDQAFELAGLYERSPRSYRVAYWYWEFDAIPDVWIQYAETVDEVWAATEFVARGLRNRLSVPVHTLFPGVQLGTFVSRPRSYFGVKEAPYTFLFTFHMMSVMERKNPLGLIRAFKQAFRDDSRVQLVLKTSFGDRHPEQFRLLEAAVAAVPNITIINEVYSSADVLSLMDACDAYVSLHRSEGLGLTMAEAMLLGKPVIATNFSGNVDFMNASNSLLVNYELVKLGKAIQPYEAHYEWAQPSEAHAADLMRRVFDNQTWAKKLGALAASSAKSNLSPLKAGANAAKRLSEISALQSHSKDSKISSEC